MTEKEAACAAYIDAVNDIYRKGNGTEVSYRDALSPLLRSLLPNRGVTNEPKPMERNKPDYTITADPDGGLLIAIVETKKIGAGDLAGKKDSGYKEQFDRYKAAYQTIAFTDFLDFHFYGNGAFSDSVRIGEVVDDGIRPLAENFGKFVALIERLGDAEPQTITSPTQLAQLMAAKARLLQVAAQKFLSSGNAKGSTATDLKGHLNISHQAARNMAARLMAKGLLSSSFSEEDGRSKRIFPTPEGERVYQALIADGSDAGEDLFSALSLPEKEELNRLLDKLNRVIEKALQ